MSGKGNGNGNGSGNLRGNNGSGTRAKGKDLFYCYFFQEGRWSLYFTGGQPSLEDVRQYPIGAFSLHSAKKSALVSLKGEPPDVLPTRSPRLAKEKLRQKGITVHQIFEC
jgi:hypothetical protein